MTAQTTIGDLMTSSKVRFGTSGARGLVADMTANVCYAYTAAFLQVVPAVVARIALAIDLRPSSPAIASACAAAIEAAGLEVDYCGAIPTPALALYAQVQGIPAIMVTGSHIPFDRNGIKFYSATGEITKAEEGKIAQAKVTLPEDRLTIPLPVANTAARETYLQRYLDFFPANFLVGHKIAVYEHSSIARDLLKELLVRLGAHVLSLGRTDDFVPIDTEAVSRVDVDQAKRWAVEYGFDAILSTDGDADRPLVGDETGEWLRGDITGILCAQSLGAKAVVTTVSCNTAIEGCGAFPEVYRTKIGSPYVIEGIDAFLAEGKTGVVGFEPNGGFLVGSSIVQDGRNLAALKTRDAFLPMLCLLAASLGKRQKLSTLSRALPPRFTASDRIQDFPTDKSRALLAELTSSPTAIDALLAGLCGRALALDQTDGLRITLEGNEMVHLRPSGNAPELRCYAEADSSERAMHLVDETLQRLSALNKEVCQTVPVCVESELRS